MAGKKLSAYCHCLKLSSPLKWYPLSHSASSLTVLLCHVVVRSRGTLHCQVVWVHTSATSNLGGTRSMLHVLSFAESCRNGTLLKPPLQASVHSISGTTAF